VESQQQTANENPDRCLLHAGMLELLCLAEHGEEVLLIKVDCRTADDRKQKRRSGESA
jgi:hypothetical protein